ncbi:MAG: carboxypeptidase-like regulatory domain-containing protein [Planctomycetota bacterium]
MKRLLLAGAVAVVVAAGLYLGDLGGSRDERTREVNSPVLSAPPRADADAPTEQAELVAAPEASAPIGETESAASAEATARTAVEAAAAAGPGLALRVVDEGGAGIAGAEVLWLSTEVADDLEQPKRSEMAAFDGWIETHASRSTTGRDGLVRLAAEHGEELIVVATHGDLYGRGSFRRPAEDEEQSAEPHELALSLDIALVVEVYDAGGAPAEGVPVELREVHSNWRSDFRQAVTDAEGRAGFPHLQNNMPDENGTRWDAHIDGLFAPALLHELDPFELPSEPVRFTLPATGSLEITVLDVERKPWAESARVSVSVVPEGERKEVSPFSANRRESISRSVDDGVARFEHVGVGLELAVSATRQGNNVASRNHGPGPLYAGAEARIELVFGSDHPVIQVHVVGVDGEPLAGETIRVKTESGVSFLSNEFTQSPSADANGRLRFDIGAAHADGDERTALLSYGPAHTPTGSARLDLSRGFEPGLHDLGRVELAPPPVFLAGQVLDPTGAPAAGAKLKLRKREESNGYWEDVWNFSHKSDDEGRFRVLTPERGERFRLGARKDETSALPVECVAGDDQLVLQLAASGAIGGTLLLDDDIAGDGFVVEAQAVAEEGDSQILEWDDQRTEPGEDGTFELDDLFPGTYDVTIRLDGDHNALLTVEGVQVVGGQTTRDPRLQQVDLRGRIFVYRFTMVLPDGSSDINGNLRYGDSGANPLQAYKWFNEAEFDLFAQHRPIDVDVQATGFLTERVRGLDDDVAIELKTGLSVRIVLRGDADLPEPPFYIKPALAPVGGNPTFDWGADPLDEEREVVVRNVEPGEMRVLWLIERRADSGAMATSVDPDPPQLLTVLPGIDDQVFEVTLSQEQMAELLASFPR